MIPATESLRPPRHRGIGPRGVAFIGLLLVLVLVAASGRGLWDPDEGRYTNVALNMLDSGDWVHPMRSHHSHHWTKPPLTYWAIATSVSAFGYTPLAARVPGILAFIACIALTATIARSIAPGTGNTAALVYATMALPVVGAQWVSTDMLLAATVALAMLGYVRARWTSGETIRRAWISLMWLGFGLGFLIKGPPALLTLLPILAMQSRPLGPGVPVRLLFWPPALALFLAVGASWYLKVVLENPGLINYLVGTEVVERVAGAGLNRNPEWYGWMKVYLPVLLLGTLPWTDLGWAALRRLPVRVSAWWRDPARRQSEAGSLLVWLWLFLPLAAFCLARSRMPLYLLPYFPAIAILVAAEWRSRRPAGELPSLRVGAWLAFLALLVLAWASWPTDKDARSWAEQIRSRTAMPVEEVVFIDHPVHNGLHLHLGARVERLSLRGGPERSTGAAYDHLLAAEFEEDERDRVFVTSVSRWPAIRDELSVLGLCADPLGEPYAGSVIFVVERCEGTIPPRPTSTVEP